MEWYADVRDSKMRKQEEKALLAHIVLSNNKEMHLDGFQINWQVAHLCLWHIS